jgi:hypothetical protein
MPALLHSSGTITAAICLFSEASIYVLSTGPAYKLSDLVGSDSDVSFAVDISFNYLFFDVVSLEQFKSFLLTHFLFCDGPPINKPFLSSSLIIKKSVCAREFSAYCSIV